MIVALPTPGSSSKKYSNESTKEATPLSDWSTKTNRVSVIPHILFDNNVGFMKLVGLTEMRSVSSTINEGLGARFLALNPNT